MSIITTFPFTTPGNYTLTNTEVSGGSGKLALVSKPSQIFNEPFAADPGFTYDNTQTEFVAGLMQQKDQSPANSIFAANYSIDKDLNWHKGGGSLVGTLNGTPSFIGKMVCTGTQGVYYTANTAPIESHKFKYTPNYSGAPPTNINLVTV